MATKKATEKQGVTLLTPHNHGGKQKKKGDKIDVTPDQVAWLQSRGIIK